MTAIGGTVFAGITARDWDSAAAALAAGIASFMVGGIAGFLFGIPFYATSTALAPRSTTAS